MGAAGRRAVAQPLFQCAINPASGNDDINSGITGLSRPRATVGLAHPLKCAHYAIVPIRFRAPAWQF